MTYLPRAKALVASRVAARALIEETGSQGSDSAQTAFRASRERTAINESASAASHVNALDARPAEVTIEHIGEVSHLPLTRNVTTNNAALIEQAGGDALERCRGRYIQDDDEESIDSLFDFFITLGYDSRDDDDRCIPYGWSVERPAALYGSSEPIGTAANEFEAVTETAKFFSELVDKKISVVMDLRHPKEINEGNLNLSYPEGRGETRAFDQMLVTCLGVQRLGLNLAHSVLTVRTQPNNQNASNPPVVTEVHRYHYLKWPDMEVIPPIELINLGKILFELSSQGTNLLVHCMGGAGRTGTLVTYLQSKYRLIQPNNARLNTPENINKIRQQIIRNRKVRGGDFVEVPEQLDLILQALRLERLA